MALGNWIMNDTQSGTHNSPQLPMNTYWVVPGRFAAGEYPGALNRREAAYKLSLLLEAGISHFVDLTGAGDRLAPYADLAAREADRLRTSVEYCRHSIVDLDVPQSRQHMVTILDAIDAALSEGQTVYVHCWGGVGRTGTVVGCWLVRHGMSGDEALDQIAEWWTGMEKAYRTPRSPEMPAQREYVRNWREPSQEGAG